MGVIPRVAGLVDALAVVSTLFFQSSSWDGTVDKIFARRQKLPCPAMARPKLGRGASPIYSRSLGLDSRMHAADDGMTPYLRIGAEEN